MIKGTSKKINLIALLIAAGLLYVFLPAECKSALSLEGVQSHLEILRERSRSHLAVSLGIFAFVYIISAALSLPWATLLSLLGGALFEGTVGTLVVLLSATMGATLAMLASRILFRDWVRNRFGKRLTAVERGFAEEGAFYLFALRLAPVFPFFLINLLMGLTPIKTVTYFWVSLVGMAPATVVIVFAGEQLATLTTWKGLISLPMLSAFAFLGLSPLVSKKAISYLRVLKGRE